jgi:cation transporter-like permease
MEILGTIVDTEALWQSVAAAVVAGLGVIVAFSVAVLGVARFADFSRDRRPVAATLFGALAVAGLLVTAGAIAVGIIVVTE